MAGIHPGVGGLGGDRAGCVDPCGGGCVEVYWAAGRVSAVDFREGFDAGAVVDGRVDPAAVAGGPIAVFLRDGGVGFFNGNIANVCIYDRALTASEVLQNYNTQKSRFGL